MSDASDDGAPTTRAPDEAPPAAATTAPDRAPAPAPPGDASASFRVRMTTAFGWIAGVALGVLVNYGIFSLVGDGYPTIPTTFVAVVAGAFGGMAIADRFGERGFRPLGVAAGVLMAILLWLVVAVLVSPPEVVPAP